MNNPTKIRKKMAIKRAVKKDLGLFSWGRVTNSGRKQGKFSLYSRMCAGRRRTRTTRAGDLAQRIVSCPNKVGRYDNEYPRFTSWDQSRHEGETTANYVNELLEEEYKADVVNLLAQFDQFYLELRWNVFPWLKISWATVTYQGRFSTIQATYKENVSRLYREDKRWNRKAFPGWFYLANKVRWIAFQRGASYEKEWKIKSMHRFS